MDDESCDENNEDLFEEELKDISTDIMVQNIFFPKIYMIILKLL